MPNAFTAGQKLTAAILNGLFPGLGGWEPYTPVWTATTNPVLGNGTLTGSYARSGKTVHYKFHLVVGSTTTFGTGAWQFSAPFNSITGGDPAGICRILDASPANQYMRFLFFNGGANVAGIGDAVNSFLSGTSPITFATGDQIIGGGTYLTAA